MGWWPIQTSRSHAVQVIGRNSVKDEEEKCSKQGDSLMGAFFCILGSKDNFGHNIDRKLYNPWDNCRMQLSEEVDAWSRLQGVSTKNLNV